MLLWVKSMNEVKIKIFGCRKQECNNYISMKDKNLMKLGRFNSVLKEKYLYKAF